MRGLLPLFVAAALFGCSRPRVVQPGSTLKLHYTASVDGKIHESSEDRAPVEITLGRGALPHPLELALRGRRAGEEVSLTVVDAYGPREPRKVEVFPLKEFGPLGPKLAPGLRVLGSRGAEADEATVLKVEGGRVWLDFNHRLAGKTVSFRVRILSVRD